MKETTLLKFLIAGGVGSRRFCFELIREGKIKINDIPVTQPLTKVSPEDKITYNEKQVKFVENIIEPVYIMMNKPQKFISSVSDEEDKPSILRLIKHRNLREKHLFPVGRLDFLTEGFIFITNDGYFSNYLLRAKNKIPKYYYVEIKGNLEEKDTAKIRKGIHTMDDIYRVEELKILSYDSKSTRLVIKLIEGKNREIRNIFSYLKYKIKYLKRFQIGPFRLDPKLKPGEYKLISKREIVSQLGDVFQDK